MGLMFTDNKRKGRMSSMFLYGRKLAVIAVCLSLGACATYDRTKPAPAQQGPISVNVTQQQLSGWTDLPVGAFKVPESDVVITGHQKGQAAGMMFGLLGVAIAHAANANAAAAGASNSEQVLRMKLSDEARTAVTEVIATTEFAQKFKESAGAGAQLDITPALILSYVDTTNVRPYTVLKVALAGSDKKPMWETRYFASTGDALPLEGPGSWTDQGGKSLKENVSVNLRQALKVLLSDVSQPAVRDDKQMTLAESAFPFIKPRLQILGYKLSEDGQYVAFVPKIGDAMVLSGINVLDKRVTIYRPAKADDKLFKVVDQPATAIAPAAPASASAAAASAVASR